ncbi:MFS transporter [Arthrobacter sp. 35W]|uniref:MFS transporter n=1 Tax=Arthrobacter sp. 35W TaxID=1132441 RepID=UPI0004203972|nr:MFS transporter [Arthrobacter sp. 35W]
MTSSSGNSSTTASLTTVPPLQPAAQADRGKTPRRLVATIAPATFSISLVWGAVPSILLALQVQQAFGEEAKVAVLALVTTIGAIAAMLAQPIAGALSDRTRSRFGKRAPWIVAGSLCGGLALVGMAFANNLAFLIVAWVMVQIGYNFAQGPLSAIMPDRVPRSVRGTFAAVLGLGSMFGSLGGQIFAASLSKNIPAAYLLLAGFAVIVLTLFVVFNPDRSSKDAAVEPFILRNFAQTFWVSPIKHPDFFWAFTSRMLTYVGYFVVIGYKLYILQDYLGLGQDAIGLIPALGLISLAGLLVSTLAAGRLSDRMERRKPFVFASGLIVATALFIPLVLPTVAGMLIMAGLAGFGFGCFQAVDAALISEVLPSDRSFAKDLGVVNIAVTLPQILAPAVAGAIVLAFGYAPLFPIGAAIGVLGALAVIPIKSVK